MATDLNFALPTSYDGENNNKNNNTINDKNNDKNKNQSNSNQLVIVNWQGRIHGHKSLLDSQKAKASPTDGRTDGPMDGRTYF